MFDLKQTFADRSPFTPRSPTLSLLHLVIIGCVIAILLMFIVNFGNSVFVNFMVIIISAILMAMIYFLQNKTFDEKTATEFQCVVFSGSMRCNTLLTVIIYQDGSIFYLDPRYLQNFDKAKPTHNLDQLLEVIGLDYNDRLQVYDSIKESERAEYQYVYKAGKQSIPLKISVTPIQRPEGFVNLSLLQNNR